MRILIVLAVVAGLVRADDVILKNGNRLQGEILSRKDGRLVIRLPYGTATLDESKIASVVEGPTPWELYAEKAAALRRQDVAGHLALAKWCEEIGLREEMKEELLAVLKISPDHAEARAMRGEVEVHGVWVPEAVGMQVLGYVRDQGRWRPKEAVAREEAEKDQRRERRQLEKAVEVQVRRMASRSAETRRAARDELVRLAKAEELPHLAAQAEQLYQRYEAWWIAHGHAIVEARLQQATLVNLRRRSTSLGTGSPVTLELPEVRTVRIGTTVGIPLGR